MNITLFVIGCVVFTASFITWNIIGHPIGPDMRKERPAPGEVHQPQQNKVVNIISVIGMISGLVMVIFPIIYLAVRIC